MIRAIKNAMKKTTATADDIAKLKAEKLNQEYINEILGYDLQEKYNDIIKSKGYILDDPLTEALLFGGGAVLLGGGTANALNNNENELTPEQLKLLETMA